MAAILDLYAGNTFWVWAGLAAGLLAIEVMSGSGWLLWASASAAAAGAAAAGLSLPLSTAVLVFALLTLTSTLLARRYLPPSAASEGGDINDNHARLVGQRAAATQAFKNGAGRVSIDGKEWPADLEAGGALAAGAAVEVVNIRGVRLLVRAL
jgi:inner membrane protein